MRRTLSLFLILFLVFAAAGLFAQEEAPPENTPQEPAPPIDSEWIDYELTPYSRGDKTFSISLGVIFPTVFGGAVENNQHNLSIGGVGSLTFNYFFTPRFFFGGELGGMFTSTRGNNMLYMVPFGLRAGYQFVFRRFEFPLSLMIGAVPTKYTELGYFGLLIKPGASIFWRFNPSWSFGLNSAWWFVPQWPNHGGYSYGNFLELTLSARYHF